MILLDTGPLVALFDPRDRDSTACHEILEAIREPLYTSEAVVTEALHLLQAGSRGAEGLKQFLIESYATVLPLDHAGLERAFELMDRYADCPMDFADATLIVLAEKLKTRKIFTLDWDDFSVYRIKRGYRHYPVDLVLKP